MAHFVITIGAFTAYWGSWQKKKARQAECIMHAARWCTRMAGANRRLLWWCLQQNARVVITVSGAVCAGIFVFG
jgi:hypothetical protein